MHISACSDNTHLNNLLESTSTTTVDGWTIDCNKGVWTRTWLECQNWFGWGTVDQSNPDGSISTILSGFGGARLDFGNCHSSGTVKVFLDGQEIGSADALIPHNVVEFNFIEGSELTISEHDVAVIQFNSLQIIDCHTAGIFLTVSNSWFTNIQIELGLIRN